MSGPSQVSLSALREPKYVDPVCRMRQGASASHPSAHVNVSNGSYRNIAHPQLWIQGVQAFTTETIAQSAIHRDDRLHLDYNTHVCLSVGCRSNSHSNRLLCSGFCSEPVAFAIRNANTKRNRWAKRIIRTANLPEVSRSDFPSRR